MRRGGKLLALLAALALVLGAYLLLRGHKWEDDTADAAESVVLADRASADVASISWSYAGETVTLAQTDGVWSDPDDAAFPVDQDAAVRLAAAAASVTSGRALGAAAKLADYGLAEPFLTVEAAFTDGEAVSYALGDVNDVTGEYYAACGGEVYMLDDTLPESFSLRRWDLIEPETLPALADPTAIELRDGETALSLIKEEGSGRSYSDEYVWFCETPDGLAAADNDAVAALTDAVASLDLGDVAAYDASDEELAAWGLAEPSGRAVVRYQADGSARALTLEFGAAEDGLRVLRLEGSRMVYRVAEADAAAILALSYERDLRPDEVCRLDINAIESLDVALDGEEYTIYAAQTLTESGEASSDAETGTQTDYVYTSGGKELNSASVRSALAAIYAMSAKSRDGDEASAGESVLTLTYRGAWGEMTLDFLDYDADTCLARFNGAAYQLCNRSAVDTVTGFLREALGIEA